MKILHNAKIYTLDKTKPAASVLVIEHGRVVGIGGDELTREFKAYLTDSLLVWLVDVHSMEEKAATRKLRARLECFSPKTA